MFQLPEGYTEAKKINFQKDKKLSILANVGAFVIAIVMVALALPSHPLLIPTDVPFLKVVGAFVVALVLYIVLHEVTHGVCFRIFSGKWGNFGYTGLYAYAGSEAYYYIWQYLIIGLAPVVLFGVIFFVLNMVLPPAAFWFVYLLQITNISGAAGDFYTTVISLRMPKDTLVQDSGLDMTFYNKTK